MVRALQFALIICVAAAAAQAQDIVRPVKTMVLESRDDKIWRQFFGNVVARQTVDLAFQVSGQVTKFPVLEGATVSQGDLIAELDLEPFELALTQAQIQKDQADRDRQRIEQLSTTTVSQASRDDALSSAELAGVSVRNAEYELEHATLHAPFDGIIAARSVANFTTVQAGTPIVRIHDVSEWRIEIGVSEVLFRRAGKDPDVELFAVFSGSDRRIPLEVREFNAEASQVGQTFQITLAMLEEPGEGVLPGTSVTVFAALHVEGSGIEIPASAVVIDDAGGTSVMLFEPGDADNGTARRTDVTLTAGPDGEFVVDGGIAPGAELIVAGASELDDGQAVRRFSGFPN